MTWANCFYYPKTDYNLAFTKYEEKMKLCLTAQYVKDATGKEDIRSVQFTCTGCSGSVVLHWSFDSSMTSHTLCTIQHRAQHQFRLSCTDKQDHAAVVQAQRMVADYMLHNVVFLAMTSTALVQCCTTTGPTLHWHHRHCCTSAELFGQIERTYCKLTFTKINDDITVIYK